MSSNALYTSLLRPPILHILRAAGFHAAKPAVIDTLVDLAARYLTLVASKAAAHSQENHNDLVLTTTDMRMALQDVGALWPQKTAMEEHITGQEDLRGIEAFVKWMEGEEHQEIRRIAKLEDTEVPVAGTEGSAEKEDFLSGLGKVPDFKAQSLGHLLRRSSYASREAPSKGLRTGLRAYESNLISGGNQPRGSQVQH
ncbi:MAG: hypothetical protein Q9183_003745 [Haloplaca sp. 2 TL-2023]